jgi:hypothetical protein
MLVTWSDFNFRMCVDEWTGMQGVDSKGLDTREASV